MQGGFPHSMVRYIIITYLNLLSISTFIDTFWFHYTQPTLVKDYLTIQVIKLNHYNLNTCYKAVSGPAFSVTSKNDTKGKTTKPL